MATPLVKVIVPCFNYAHFLPGCVESILGQEGVDVSVLVVDDTSPDDTPAVSQALIEADDRVEYRRHLENIGLISTVNEGLGWADDADYVVVISADDRLAPGALARSVKVMSEHPSVGMAYGSALRFEDDETMGEGLRERWQGTKVWKGRRWVRVRCREGHNCIASPEAMVRVAVQRQVGEYDLDSHHASELNMWLRIAAISDIAYIKGAHQAFYRVHQTSMLRTMLRSKKGALTDISTRRIAFNKAFDSIGSGLPGAERLRGMANRALASQALWIASRAYDKGSLDDAEGAAAGEWIEFAAATYPELRRLPRWWGLKARQRIGAGRSLWFPLFIATGAGHRARVVYNRHRLQARGI
ncbi:MAG TPA: glycosyltransferase family A protein [Solirubrobacterales bacterium]